MNFSYRPGDLDAERREGPSDVIASSEITGNAVPQFFQRRQRQQSIARRPDTRTNIREAEQFCCQSGAVLARAADACRIHRFSERR